MAIIAVTSCLGPPPLPPGKRFFHHQRSTAASKKLSMLSSTYLSFRDPAIEYCIPMVHYHDYSQRHAVIKSLPPRPQSRASTYTIQNDDFNFPPSTTNLFRSQSEGNLRAKKYGNVTLNGLDKCIKAIYGSWKNLIQCKCII